MNKTPEQTTEEACEEKVASNPAQLSHAGIKKKFWSSDKFLSLLAFLISVGTFFTFAYQTYLIQKQQYANMMPHLLIEKHNDGRGEYFKRQIILRNYGVGPAFIKDVRIHYQDSTYHKDPSEFYRDYPDTIASTITNQNIFPGSVVPAGESVVLIGSDDEAASEKMYRLFYSDAVIEIDYSSIYDEVWIVSSDTIPYKIEQ
uniref:Uncharacterized protein n=1 Tax=Roseihalotalea indica TaxID=2867963 RepID=A0AA49JJ55_9BACT|nr:hypothetical protein K4G66_07500 [Tunicatimonas sp. TK19036]